MTANHIRILIIFILGMATSLSHAQITTIPALPTEDRPVTIIFDATQGSGDMAGFTGDVYAHTGVTLKDGSEWQYVIGGWGNNETQPQLTRIDDDLYELEISPSIRDFYDVNDNDTITGMHFVFRAPTGSPQTEDLFVQVAEEGLSISLREPSGLQPVFELHDQVPVEASANEADSIALFINQGYIISTTEESLSYTWDAETYGNHEIEVIAYGFENESVKDSTRIFVRDEAPVAELPEGVKPGVTYHDENSATLVLHDPPALKEYVFLIGDMNDWHPTENHYMNRTPDGTHYWITLEGLEADTEYGYQFYIDGELRLADPYTHKVLDPWNDEYITESTYPGLKDYPEGKTEGLVSILHPGRPAYQWQAEDFNPPAREDLVVYELLIRDFTEAGTIKAVQDSLDYLQNLGVNVIELMPVNEFEGNISWGYNPALYFATDKAYGPQEAYKEFIDECHQRGIAVVLDIVLNHSFNLSPLVQMYFDEDAGSWGAPMPENPWYLTDCPHEPWCWGNTFDQESEHTKDFFRRVTQYWLTEFRVDGFRFDFTKGFTNEQTGNQGWNYDQARIDNLKRIANEVWEANPDAYVILEHFTANNEERELAEYGMMLWGNITHAYQEAAMGWIDDSNFEWISYQQRGWNEPHLVGYMESHDEERMMYKNINYGNNHQDDYNIRDLSTALKRAELAATFYFPIPGPKMIWQFGELGYDYSINYCADGSIDDGCRTDPKPVRWDYYDDYRRKNLYDIYATLAQLKTSEDVFRTDDYTLQLEGEMKRIHLNHESNNVTIVGNFGLRQEEIDPNFQETGTWHEYFSREEITVDDVNATLTLEPGEYRMYSTEPFEDHGIPLDADQPDIITADEQIKVYPNPVRSILNIEAPENIVEVQVIDLVGRTMMQRPAGSRQMTLELGDLHTGIYFIRVRTASAIITERIQVVR